jgi:hypothetical protein
MSSSYLVVALGAALACTGACTSPSDTVLDVVFDVCEPFVVNAPEASAVQREGIERALELWRDRGVEGASTTLAEGVPVVEVRFADASPAFHGVYEDEVGVIYINSRLGDPETLAVVMSHELGHAFGLWHVSDADRHSVMNPGNLDVTATLDDGLALTALWGACATARRAPQRGR